LGSIDDFAVNALEEYDPEQQAIQDQVPVIRQQTQTLGIGWRRRFRDNSGLIRATLSTNNLLNRFQQYENNVEQTGLFLDNDSRETETRLKFSYTRFQGKWTTTYGVSAIAAAYRNRTSDLINDRSFDSSLDFLRYGLFAQTSVRLADDRLGWSFGLRTDGNTFTDSGHELYRTLSPRMALSYQLSANGNWTANASLGRYYKILPYTSLGFQDAAGEFVNRDTRYITSDHAVLGLEYLVSKAARITLEGFYKHYDNYPVSVADQISLANKGAGFEVFGSEAVVSTGKGRTYGAELLFQQKFTGKWYAIAALTLYSSEFGNGENADLAPSGWDNGVLVSLLGGYKFGRNWEVSSRYRYLGGAPYAPVDQTATLAAYPSIIRDYSRLGSVRLDPFGQLDLRIDKKWNFRGFSLDVFVDVQNVLGKQQPSEPQFGLDRDEQGEIITPERLVQVMSQDDGSVLPSLGLVFDF
jgi:hypothetical protein